MSTPLKSLSQMNSDSLRYLVNNTDITYLAEGSIARALVETTNLEISRLGEYMAAVEANSFLDSASGPYLDVIAENYGIQRITNIRSSTSKNDKNVRFYINQGKLGDILPDPNNTNQGLINAGIEVSTSDGSITYKTTEKTYFDKRAKEAYVSVQATSSGDSFNVGKGKLTSHNGPVGMQVINESAIANGISVESDRNFRYRIANNLAASPTANETSIRLALLRLGDIADIDLIEAARGAGTFDALLVPVGNTVNTRALNTAQRIIDQVSAFGINGRAIQPVYKRVKITIRLIPVQGAGFASVDINKVRAKNAILDYLETISIGGEFIVNRLRSSIIEAVDATIRDIRVLEICINDRPHIIRNVSLRKDEVFVPDLVEII